MRHRDQTAGCMDQLRDGPELGQRLLDECGTPATQKAIERVAQIYGPAVADDGPRNVGPAHRASGRFLKHAFEREVDSQPPEVLDHLLGATHPIGPAALEECVELRRVRRQKIAQHVHLAPGRGGRKLTPAHHPNSVLFTGRERFRDASQGIVIGQRDGPESRCGCTFHDAPRQQTSIRGGRVHVQIDRVHRV